MLRFSRAVTLWCVSLASLAYIFVLTKNRYMDTTALVDIMSFWAMGGFLVYAANDKCKAIEQIKEREALARFLPGPLVERVRQNPGALKLGGDIQEATILFADIRGFTTLSQGLPPREVVTLLNEYFSNMVDEIFHWEGILDKFMGDGLYAVFGPPHTGADQAQRAVRCARFMLRRLAYINGRRHSRGEPLLRIGIGIHTGLVVAGNVGSRERMEYTHIGDAVNTTSRIEELCKEYGEVLLVSEATYTRAGGPAAFPARPMPPAILRGRNEPVNIYAMDVPGAEFRKHVMDLDDEVESKPVPPPLEAPAGGLG